MTRYPKAGKGSRWTELALKAATAAWHGDTLADGDGLNGEVRIAADGRVAVAFKYGYKWLGSGRKHYCGTWPDATLAAIRAERERARERSSPALPFRLTCALPPSLLDISAALKQLFVSRWRHRAGGPRIGDYLPRPCSRS